MAWNEPDNDDRKNDAWGNNSRGSKNQGPPDIDELLGSLLKKFSKGFGGSKGNRDGSGSASGGDGLSGGLIIGVLVIAAIIWAASGFYTVDEQERGVVLRFGRALDELVPPGLHWNPPLVDEVNKINVTRVYDKSFSNTMLTEDDNIVDVTMSVQYVITDPRKFFLEVRDPESSLEQAAESALRHVVGSSVMTNVLTVSRAQIAQEVRDRLQSYLDNYGTGITISQVNVNRSQPPEQVRAAFDDVIKADEDNRSLQNEARAYASQIVPEARGAALRQIQEANAYKEQVIAQAQGEAARFESLLTEYRKSPEVTRQRLYLDTLQSVMSSSSKVMIDVEGSNNMMYLPLDKLMERRPAPDVSGRIEGLNNQDIRNLSNQVIRDIQSRPTTTTRGAGR
ncbi:MAG: FtsH protease activity modulator HflK [Pseudomonadales bacterium]|nr:FtsH protease activity modulator HflK [Pseudomonadales bacterium]